MGIGHVQGRSRVPPDHPEGGAGGELYSEGLWWAAARSKTDANPGKARPYRTSSGARGAVRTPRACLSAGLPPGEAGGVQRNGPLDLVRISDRTTTSIRQASPSHEPQSVAFVPEDAGEGVTPTGSATGGCAWAKPAGTFQVKTGPSVGPKPSSSVRTVMATSPWRLAGTRHECAQLPPQPNSNWPRPTTASACRIVNCGGAFSLWMAR